MQSFNLEKRDLKENLHLFFFQELFVMICLYYRTEGEGI